MGKKFFPMEAWQFFFDIMETMAKERANSLEVYLEYWKNLSSRHVVY